MGASYLCYALKVLGVALPGGMQEYWTVDAARLLRVPDALSDDHAALIEPLAVATHDVRRAAVKRDDTVLVFGGGPIGALIALVSRQRGARVVVAEVNRHRLETLNALGLETVGPDRDPVKFATEWTGGTGVDVAFEVSGHPAARSEEHTSELQSRLHLVCRLLLEKKKNDSHNNEQCEYYQFVKYFQSSTLV